MRYIQKADYRTVVNMKQQINNGKQRDHLVKVIESEAQALVNTWTDPKFPPKMIAYMKSL